MRGRILLQGVLIFLISLPCFVLSGPPVIQNCRLTPIVNKCFSIAPDMQIGVGSRVSSLGTKYYFCLPFDTVLTIQKPLRVIFAIDQSGSMCQDGGCVGTARNDPLDMRIQAAKAFIDSLRAHHPLSEAGIVRFSDKYFLNGALAPLQLTDANIVTLKAEIDKASCKTMYGQPKKGASQASKMTFMGLGFDSALSLADYNYDAIINTLDRHIIILTDGDWGDTNRLPEKLLMDYRTQYPVRMLPRVHGVFISDSAFHVQHGFPPAGATSCGAADTTYIDTQYLAYVTETTNGYYYACTNSAMIGQRMQVLLAEMSSLLAITAVQPRVLKAISFINQKNSQVFPGSIVKASSGANTYQVTTAPLPLDFGMNNYTIQQTIGTQRGDTVCSQILTVNRSVNDTAGPFPGMVFTITCDSGNGSIREPVFPHAQKSGFQALQIYDLTGRKVGEYAPDTRTGFLPRGVYVVRKTGKAPQFLLLH
jgi:hypothetical protein